MTRGNRPMRWPVSRSTALLAVVSREAAGPTLYEVEVFMPEVEAVTEAERNALTDELADDVLDRPPGIALVCPPPTRASSVAHES